MLVIIRIFLNFARELENQKLKFSFFRYNTVK